jgi:hypothetical protein
MENSPYVVQYSAAELEMYQRIGKFFVAFSEVEHGLRWTVRGLLELPDDDTEDVVTGGYDYSTLCRVTERLLLMHPEKGRAPDVVIKETIKLCLSLADVRNTLAHGSWHAKDGVRHVARGKLVAKHHFQEPEQLEKATEKAIKVSGLVLDLYVMYIGEAGNSTTTPSASEL